MGGALFILTPQCCLLAVRQRISNKLFQTWVFSTQAKPTATLVSTAPTDDVSIGNDFILIPM